MRAREFRGFAPLWVVGALMLIAALAVTSFALAGQPMPRRATAEQEDQFLQLYQQYRRVHFDASVTGDVSQFPTIFTNDPAIDLAKFAPDCIPLTEQEIDGVRESLTELGVDSDATFGLLSCVIAEQLEYHRSVDQWQRAKDQAAAEHRQPATQDLPEGSRPVEPTDADDWTEHDMYVTIAEMFGEYQAHVAYSAMPEAKSTDHLLHIRWTRVNDKWYASAIWTSGNP